MTEPFRQTPEQREAWAKSRRRQGMLRSVAARDDNSYGSNLARKLLADESAGAINGPVDEAVRKLRRAGYVVYNATVVGGPVDKWVVDHRTMTAGELLAFAGAR